MNKISKVVWSHVRQQFVVVSEVASSVTRTHSRRSRGARTSAVTLSTPSSLRMVALACCAFLSVGAMKTLQAQTLPQGGQVVAGQGSIQTAGSVMTINQSTAKLAVDWQSFSIGQGKTVEFVQPSSSAVALNRVLGTDVSVIQGALKANGQVFLVNPNGVLFSKDAQVNVGGIVASTLNIKTDDFMADNYRFEGVSSNAIVNQGNITAGTGGTVALIAAKISNTGQINAERGNVLIGAGSKVKLDLGGPVKIEVEQGAIDALIEQGGGIRADGGLVYLTAKAVGQLTTTVINHTGITEARTLATGEKGEIYLMGGMEKDRIVVGGKLDASAPNGGDGGFVETSAANVQVQDDLRITTRSLTGRGGTWLIDPTDFTIASADPAGSVSGGQATGSYIKNTTLQTALGAGDVLIATSSAANGSDTGAIHINADVTWATNKLTLEAQGNININANLNAQSNASLDMKAGYSTPGSAGGTYDSTKTVLVGMNAAGSFKGKVSFYTDAGSTARSGTGFLTINGQGYTVITELGTAGAGTSGEPTVGVNTLQGLAHTSMSSSSGRFALGADIDASSTSTWNGGAGFYPLGLSSSFMGVFDGLGHTISGLRINRSSTTNVGLFSWALKSTIRNIGLTGMNITGSGNVGGLVGKSSAAIINAYSTGSVSGGANVGGLVGNNKDDARTWGTTAVGAIGGSHSDAIVSGSSYVGGLVGVNDTDPTKAAIKNSYATGPVTASSDNVGGLIGVNWTASVTNSYYNLDSVVTKIGTSVVKATPYGLYGAQYSDWFNSGVITPLSIANYNSLVSSGTNNYTINSIQGMKDLLGFADKGQYTFSLAADIDLVTLPGFYVPILKANFDGAGHTISNLNLNAQNPNLGMFGTNWGTISNLGVLNANVSGWEQAGGLTGFNNYGASISNSYVSGAIAGVNTVGGLAGANQGAISGAHSLATVTASGSYEIGGLVGGAWDGTISNSYATGNVTANGPSYVGGLVGYNYAAISGSHASGNVTTTNGDYLGGLVGYSDVAISGSYATGNVTTSSGNYAGGLVGYGRAAISGSYATGNVTTSSGNYAGGLAGYSEAAISGSYATGNVSGGNAIGGLIGKANGNSIQKSYAAGSVSSVSSGTVGGLVGTAVGTLAVGSSYWDTDVAGLTSAAGDGKTTAQMKDITTYSGWDINVDSSYSGSVVYPRLTMTGSSPIWLIKSVSSGGGGGGGGNSSSSSSTNSSNSDATSSQDTAIAATQSQMAQIAPSTSQPFATKLRLVEPALADVSGGVTGNGSTSSSFANAVRSGGLLLQLSEESGGEKPSGNEAERRQRNGQSQTSNSTSSNTASNTATSGRDPLGYMRVFVVRGGVNTSFNLAGGR